MSAIIVPDSMPRLEDIVMGSGAFLSRSDLIRAGPLAANRIGKKPA